MRWIIPEPLVPRQEDRRLGERDWAFCTEHVPNLARDPWGEGVKFNMAEYE